MKAPTVRQAIQQYLDTVHLARSQNTFDTYHFAMRAFQDMLSRHGIVVDGPVSALSEDGISWFAEDLKLQSPATEQLYLQAAKGFYKYLAAEKLASINLPRLDLLKQQRARRPGVRLPQFPTSDIERLLAFVAAKQFLGAGDTAEQLRAFRDRAFLLTLADTGLRVREACKLQRGQVDWNEGRAIIVGKGNKQAVVRFSTRALRALKAYLTARAPLDGAAGKTLSALPLFARHDKGAGHKIKPITTATGRLIVQRRAVQALGASTNQRITPHSLRHYFVTAVLRGSGNLKLAQELARHANIQVTQRYAHLSNDELDRGYHEIFEDHD
ncbi:MAG: tyrosine-type recombinase/integrase [Chloroflexota bacterium]